MNGDLLWHNTLWFSAKEDARRRGRGGYDFAPLLAGMKPVIASADLAICHEEVPLAAARRAVPKLSALRRTAAGRESHQGDRLRRLHNCVQPRCRSRLRRRTAHSR